MIKSMTGYGKAECETGNKKITIELKSLNSKQLDVTTRLPVLYREKDMDIRKELSEKLVRGKIEFAIYIDDHGSDSISVINEDAVERYYHQLSNLQQKLGLQVNERIMSVIMRLPESVKTTFPEIDETTWQVIWEKIQEVIDSTNKFRLQEGEALRNDIASNISEITDLLTQVEAYEDQRLVNIKARILDGLKAFELNGNLDKNRFEQELIYYLEKLDINEEKVRLTNHCQYFFETLDLDAAGKKLGFIAQEIGREINTLGSKANESNIQRIVVQMKDSLEKIKEQVLNVL